jgi:uncharacterized membrane protein YtjA (UPF0391 family)
MPAPVIAEFRTEPLESPAALHAAARVRDPVRNIQEDTMLYWAAVFFLIAIAAGAFGFFGIAAGAVGIAKILFFAFLVLAIVSLVLGRRSPV